MSNLTTDGILRIKGIYEARIQHIDNNSIHLTLNNEYIVFDREDHNVSKSKPIQKLIANGATKSLIGKVTELVGLWKKGIV